MKKLLFSFLLTVVFSFAAVAVEGMWLPLLLGLLNEAEMKQMGMKMQAEDIYSVNKGSLKDAIVQFGGGCTGEIISPDGLLLTNHHCGFGAIQSHTTLTENYLEDGFWAMRRTEELPNPNLTVTLIRRMEDVTAQVLQGVSPGSGAKERERLVEGNIEALKSSWQRESWEDVQVRPFFHGNQYFLFVTVTYRDIRLVGAPPSAIGKFGADTDNWVWPRHTGDFSLFRIYAGPDNRPADYSPDNMPYKPMHHLPISLDGVREGDFTLVFGFPGRTNQYLPSYGISQLMDELDPARITIRDQTLGIWNAAMRADPQVKIQYASKQAGIANAWKKWQGEVLGLRSTGAVAEKQAIEAEFRKRTAENPALQPYADILDQFEDHYAAIGPYALAKEYYDEINGRNIELMRLATQLNRLSAAFEKEGEAGFEKARERMVGQLARFYKDYAPALDRQVFSALMALLQDKVDATYLPPFFLEQVRLHGGHAGLAAAYYGGSWLSDVQLAKETILLPADRLRTAISSDPICILAAAFDHTYRSVILPSYTENNQAIQSLQERYMKGLMEAFPEERFYPDANGTLRCSYGKVQGYRPRDGVSYGSTTWLDGVLEKYVPGDYEFDVPERLRTLYENKDYGPYGVNKRMPVCFIGSNHTTGGNSGSPAVDAYGNLIGLNFDRVWEGTMSDYHYDLSICRNIMVDVRYILFIIDKFAGAGHLVEEMTLVRPRQQSGFKTRTNAPAGKVKPAATKPEKLIMDH